MLEFLQLFESNESYLWHYTMYSLLPKIFEDDALKSPTSHPDTLGHGIRTTRDPNWWKTSRTFGSAKTGFTFRINRRKVSNIVRNCKKPKPVDMFGVRRLQNKGRPYSSYIEDDPVYPEDTPVHYRPLDHTECEEIIQVFELPLSAVDRLEIVVPHWESARYFLARNLPQDPPQWRNIQTPEQLRAFVENYYWFPCELIE